MCWETLLQGPLNVVKPVPVQFDAGNMQVGAIFHGGTGIPLGTKTLLACLLASFSLFGDFGDGFGSGSSSRCHIQLLCDCHVGMVVIAMDIGGAMNPNRMKIMAARWWRVMMWPPLFVRQGRLILRR